MIGVVEGDDPIATRGVAGDLDGVLHGLGTRVEQRRALLVIAGGAGVQLLADGHVLLVGTDHEAGVGELGDLVTHGVDDRRVGVSDADDGDTGAEVDERVAIDVDEDRPLGAVDVEREHRADAGRDGGLATGVELLRPRAGQVGHDTT